MNDDGNSDMYIHQCGRRVYMHYDCPLRAL